MVPLKQGGIPGVGFVMLLVLMATVLAVDLSKVDAIGKYLPW